MNDSKNDSGIAIVGMAGRFPKAKNVEDFWRNLCGSVECITFFNDEELAAAGDNYPKSDPNYVKARGLLDNADKFDAAFFGVTPREAEVMDPQHRIFLECAWEALEHAGYDSEKYGGSIGVFGGMSMNTYFANNLISRPDLIAQAGEYSTMLGNDKDFLPTRVSYKMNLRGPSLNIQTACSTSLVAVCVACENLLNYNCDMALAGAVSIMFPQERGYFFQVGGISSPDGHCRPFDAKGAGTVVGGGVGIVALKRVEDAIRDGDTIYAVIKGFGVNNDGANKIGFTAPSVDGQAEAIAMAHAMAEISPDTISYVEAHGTATPLGDPIEVEGLTKAFRAGTDKKNFCAIGSVKSNVGHLDAAAGVVGLIKVALALHHKKLPPTLHFESPNPKIDFANSPFYVNSKLTDWQRNGSPLRAGISSFGIGGTNAHVVVEEASQLKNSSDSRPPQLLLLSAKTETALDAATKNLATHLKENPEINLADAAFTLQTGRREFPQRRMLVCRDVNDAVKILKFGDAKKIFSKAVARENPPVVFMFTGQGSQQINMARGIYESEPFFRETVDRCAKILQPHLNYDLRQLLFPSPEKLDEAREQLTKTQYTQPALFVVEYALAKLWMSWGILPEALIGHSIGEYVAATLAGVFSLEDGLKIVATRGKMMQELPPGTMLAVRMPENEVVPLLNGHLSLATVNAASVCVVSGANDAVAELQNELAKRNVLCTPLRTSHAFHSLMMEPILEPFTKLVKSVERRAPQIPFISNVTGKWISAEEATNPNYWAKHLRQTVRFADGIGELLKSPERVFLEVGPGQTLSNLTKQHPLRNLKTAVISSLANGKGEISDEESLLNALGQLWLSGVRPDWKKFYAREQRKRVALPTYPFERKRFWVEPVKSAQAAFALGVEVATEKEEPVEIKSGQVTPAPTVTDKNEIVSRLKILLTELSGFDLAEMDGDTTFAEMGFDSLFLTKVSLGLEKKFGVRVAFRQLLEDFSTLNLLSAHIENNLSPEKISVAAPVADELPKTANNSIVTVPLTDGQRELWFAAQMDEQTSAAYNECRLLHLHGDLQPENLVRAIQLLVNRHEALRTTFSMTGESQNIAASLNFEIARFDLASLNDGERAKRFGELQSAEARQPFDLVNGPLMRATLIRLAENHHVLILTLHHIICDGHAFGVLLRDLWKIYSAICRGEEIKLPEPLQLSEYVRAKMQTDENSLRKKSETYWLEKFSNGAPALELPTDFSRATEAIFEGGCETRLLPSTLARELKNVSAQHNSTLFVTLLGAFYAFLHQLTAQDDIVIGVPIADRNLTGADIMVGHCVNFLPIRASVEGRLTFDDFLSTAKNNFLEAHEHQHCTLGSLLQKLNLPREAGRMPLVSVTFNVDQSKGKLDFVGIEAELANNPHSYINFDLGVNLTEIDDGLQMDCRYNASLFSAETIQRWLRHFQTLLESIAKNSRQQISKLPMLSADERQKILVEWNATQMDFPREKCIHQLFEEQVARTPDATAIIFGNDEVTYSDLNLRAEEIGMRLRAMGVGPDVPVGICMERSPDVVAAMLGVLKAGGAYVPLDPNYPQDRVAFMLENSRAPILLTENSLRENFKSENSNLKILCVEDLLSGNRNGENHFNPQSVIRNPQSNNLAYVIYTSGSTGVPKGVAIEHRSSVNFISWAQKNFSREELSGMLAATSICFDLSIFEIFVPLSCGGKIILAKNALELPSLPRKNEVHLVNTVPSAIRELLRIGGVPESVRVVNLAGEPLPAELANQIYEQTRVEKVFDLYGPSETTTYSTFTLREHGGRATIGKPLANTQIYILDQNLQPVPIGVPGEIFIGGDGVARGYLHRDDLTAERFLKNPFVENSRIYKTGDIARWLPDGNIEYLGRGDRQVKIRGFRIELGEIESALLKNSAVRECVLLAREDSPGDKRLAAYIVQNSGKNISAVDLRNFLEGKLPDYMIPAFVFLDAMPLTPNGKINKRALPAPQQSRIEVAETFTAPTSPTEETLAKIWRDVLRVEKIGVRDNFFELGGHSLLVTQVVSRVRETFQIEMTMREFFNAPTISSLAAAIEDAIVEQVSQMSDEQINRMNGNEMSLVAEENSRINL